ncbi:MAG: translation initiation factor IF-3 [Candidatus Omnitrophica bacterium]|nr:translation initiation factor IF-3 [Candidatus Omnitrophota bacterium]MCA9437948.1 translation initiation factor IF-3 [Candidatus Omnitrophota bacterium]
MPQPKDRINHAIREKEVRLIDEGGDHVGVVSIQDALKRAEEAGLDLVEVSSASRPYVCRVMDYGNYKYEQAKKQKEAKKKQHTTDLKEVKLRPRISGHDYDFKLRHAKKFILAGDKVKFVVMFRGRERSHTEFGYELLEKVQEELKDLIKVDSKPSAEGRNLIMVLSPDPAGVKAEKARLEKERQRMEQEEEAEVESEVESEVED